MSFSAVLPKGDPGPDIAKRWRKMLCSKPNGKTEIDTQKLKLALEDIGHRTARLSEFQNMGTVRGTEGTGEFERYTPAKYIEAARAVLGTIELDPASCEVAQRTVKAVRYFTVADDGLKQDWSDHTWLNPPYHRDFLPAFVEKLIAECAAGRVQTAIMLTNNSTDTDWFAHAAAACNAICFTYGRIKFLEEDGVTPVLPTQGQAFFYFGPDVAAFERGFAEVGFIAFPRRAEAE